MRRPTATFTTLALVFQGHFQSDLAEGFVLNARLYLNTTVRHPTCVQIGEPIRYVERYLEAGHEREPRLVVVGACKGHVAESGQV